MAHVICVKDVRLIQVGGISKYAPSDFTRGMEGYRWREIRIIGSDGEEVIIIASSSGDDAEPRLSVKEV